MHFGAETSHAVTITSWCNEKRKKLFDKTKLPTEQKNSENQYLVNF